MRELTTVEIEGTTMALLSFARSLDVEVTPEVEALAGATARGIENAWYRTPHVAAPPATPHPDSGRLDWLETSRDTRISHGYEETDDSYYWTVKNLDKRVPYFGDSLREALDAAMSADALRQEEP